MKLFRVSLLLLSAFLLNGCLGEDTDSCPPVTDNNLILEFRYTDNQGTDIFSGKIDKVDVFVFDLSGSFVQSQSVNKASLSAFAGTRLNLCPGTYRIVCWGNALDKTLFGGLDSTGLFKDAFTGNSTLNEEGIATGGDPLFYAPRNTADGFSEKFTVSLGPEGTQKAVIDFYSAHIKVEVYIKGFEDKGLLREQLPPLVELTDIPAYYNFEMQDFGSSISYKDITSYQSLKGQELAVIHFCTSVFTEDTPMRVLIKKSSDGSTVTAISMKDFIRENNITLDTGEQITVPILVEYKGASIEITLPEWGHNPIDPEV